MYTCLSFGYLYCMTSFFIRHYKLQHLISLKTNKNIQKKKCLIIDKLHWRNCLWILHLNIEPGYYVSLHIVKNKIYVYWTRLLQTFILQKENLEFKLMVHNENNFALHFNFLIKLHISLVFILILKRTYFITRIFFFVNIYFSQTNNVDIRLNSFFIFIITIF